MSQNNRSAVGDGGPPHETVRNKYDWEAVSPSTAVTMAVAEAAGEKPEALEPLHGRVDTDGIDALFETSSGNRPQTDIFLSFRYAGHAVTISGNGVVTVEPDDGYGSS